MGLVTTTIIAGPPSKKGGGATAYLCTLNSCVDQPLTTWWVTGTQQPPNYHCGLFAPDRHIPNTSLQNKPLLHYHGAFSPSVTPSAIETHLTSAGVVEPQWRQTMYSSTHFHSTSHEVLCVSHGKAKQCFGGEYNPGKVESQVEKGDVLVLPAGVGHRFLEGGDGFEMVGSYPKGFNWDMCYGKKDEEAKVKGIAKLGWFDRDPVYGEQGPALDV